MMLVSSHLPPRRATPFPPFPTLLGLLLVLLLLLPTQGSGQLAANTIRVAPNLKEVFLDPGTYDVLEDPAGRLTLAQVRQSRWSRQFRRASSLPTTTMEHPGSAYWLRLVVRADGPLAQHWYLELFDSHLSDVTFFPADGAAPTLTGADRPLSTRKFPYKNFLFQVGPARPPDPNLLPAAGGQL